MDILVSHHFLPPFHKGSRGTGSKQAPQNCNFPSLLWCGSARLEDGSFASALKPGQWVPESDTHWRRVDGGVRWKLQPDDTHRRRGAEGFRPQPPQAACPCMRLCAFGREHNAASVTATRSVGDKSHLPVQHCRAQTERSHSPRAKSKTNKSCTSLLPILTNTSGTKAFLYLWGVLICRKVVLRL